MPSIINAATSGGLISTADTSGVLQLQTASTTAMTIDASQNVGIGTASPATKLDIQQSTTDLLGISLLNTNNSAGTVTSSQLRMGITNSAGVSYAVIKAQETNVDDWPAITFSAQNAVTTTPLERMRVNWDGNVLIGITSSNANGGCLQLKSGITFPATQSASSDANTLDDYEEGTFSPTIASGFSTAPTSYSTQRGAYTKIGRYVYFQIQLDANGTVADASGLQIGGLPFTCADASTVAHGGAFFNYQNSFDTNAGDTFHIINASTSMGVYTSAGTPRFGNSAGVNINNEFLLCGFYMTA